MKNDFNERLIGLQKHMGSFALSLTLNKEEAEDLMQETNLRVLDNQDKYVENTNFKGWVFTIMRNTFIDNYRRMVRNRTTLDATEELYHLNLPQNSGYDSPEAAYGVKEITMMINSFSEEYRQPFSMFVSGYKYEEIADVLGIPLGTVKSRIFYARRRLKKALTDNPE